MIIDKVVTVLLDADSMELVNDITGLDFDTTDNWVDLSTVQGHPKLKRFIDRDTINLLKSKSIDYIAFRLDY